MHNQEVIGISNQAKATAIVVLVTFSVSGCLILSSIRGGNVSNGNNPTYPPDVGNTPESITCF